MKISEIQLSGKIGIDHSEKSEQIVKVQKQINVQYFPIFYLYLWVRRQNYFLLLSQQYVTISVGKQIEKILIQ